MKEQILSKFLKKEKFLLTYTENLSKHIFLFFYIRNSMRKHQLFDHKMYYSVYLLKNTSRMI